MSGAGELVPRPGLRGEVLPPSPSPSGGGSTYAVFMRRLRGYVAPPPPGELGWRAAGGAGLALVSAGVITLLPAGQTIATSGLMKWVDRSGLASAMDSVGGLAEPFALAGMVMLLAIAAIYLTEWGATPALVLLSGLTWVGVAMLAVAVFASVFLLALFVINLLIWVLHILMWIALGILALMVLGLFADS